MSRMSLLRRRSRGLGGFEAWDSLVWRLRAWWDGPGRVKGGFFFLSFWLLVSEEVFRSQLNI